MKIKDDEIVLSLGERILLRLLWPVLCKFAEQWTELVCGAIAKGSTGEEIMRAFVSFCNRTEGTRK